MRSRTIPAIGVGVAALAVAVAFTGSSASAAGHLAGTSAKATGTHSTAKTDASCVSQRDNDNGVGIISQNFESTFDQYDATGADDFTVAKCTVKTVTADGLYFNGSGPADSFSVSFYKSKSGVPSKLLAACNNAPYTDAGFGTPIIKCSKKSSDQRKKKITIHCSGPCDIVIEADMAFSGGGEWGWNTNNTVRGKASVWQNPGDGFATGCTSWTTTTTCIPSGEGGDNSFSIN